MLTQSRLTKWMSICLSLALIAGQIFMIGEPAFAFDESSARELKEMHIINGDGQGNLNTDKAITRLEMAVILSTIYGEDHAAKAYSGPSDYKDAEKIAAWGKKYADFAKKNGWMVGDNNGNFNPEGLIGGEELAVLLLRNLGFEPGTWGSNIAIFKEKTGITIRGGSSITRGEIFDVLYHAVYEKESGPSSSGRKASVLEKSGKVSVKRTVSPKYIPAFVKMKVEGGDKIATDKGSWITLNFDDNKKVKFAGDTVATVDELGKTESSTSTVFVLEKGGIGTTTDGKLEPGSKYEIKTPTAVLGVRGTEFYVQVEENETEVWLVKGSVEIAYKVEGGKIKNISGAATEKTMLIDASREPVKITIPKEETVIEDEELKTETFKLDGLYEEFLISPTFPELGFTKDEIEKAIEKDREKRGTVDLNNNTNNDNRLNNDVSPFKDETTGLYGLKDKDGKIVLAPQYERIDSFSEDLAVAVKDGKRGYIDKKGKEVIPFIYSGARSFVKGRAFVWIDRPARASEWFFIDKTGKKVLPFMYERAWGVSFREELARVGKNKKYGFIDGSGEKIIPLIYDAAGSFSGGLAPVKKGEKWGYIDKTGKEVLSFSYESAHTFSEGLAPVKKGEKWGYIDKTGKEVLPYSYDAAGSFSEGLAPVKKGDKWGYIDKTAKEMISAVYDEAESFSQESALVKKNGKFGFIDKTGKELVPPIYDKISSLVDEEGILLVKNDNKYGLIDRKGNVILSPIYDVIGWSEFTPGRLTFLEGIIRVEKDGKYGIADSGGKLVVPVIYDRISPTYDKIKEKHDYKLLNVRKDGKSGIFDREGKMIVPAVYDYIDHFEDGLAHVRRDKKSGFIDTSGKVIIPLVYDGINPISVVGAGGNPPDFEEGFVRVEKEGKFGFLDRTGREVIRLIYDEARNFHSGNAVVQKDGKWGIIDKTGKEVVPLIYDGIGHFGEGMVSVRKDGKRGYIDSTGKEVLPLIYEYVYMGVFHNGLAQVEKGDWNHRKYGFIDKTGKEVIPLIYDEVTWFDQDELIRVRKDGKWGYVDKTGREIIPPIYDEMGWFNEGFIAVKKDGKWGYIDSTGRKMISPIYDEAHRFNEGMARVKKGEKWGYVNQDGKEIPLIYDAVVEFNIGYAIVEKDGEWFYIDKFGNRAD